MSYFESNPKSFRTLITALLACLITLSVVNLYNTVSDLTDQNVFTNLISKVYVTDKIPGTRLHFRYDKNLQKPDTIKEGDLIIKIDGHFASSDYVFKYYLSKNFNPEFLVFSPDSMSLKYIKCDISNLKFSNFYDYLANGLMILYVEPKGASYRAGIKVGDIITKVNGYDAKDATFTDRIMRFSSNNGIISYELLRDNLFITVKVYLANFGIQFIHLVCIFTGLLFLIFGLLIGMTRPYIRSARVLSITFMVLSLVWLSKIFTSTMYMPALNYINFISAYLAVFYGFASLFYSTLIFPEPLPVLSEKKWIKYSVFSVATILLVYCIVSTIYLSGYLVGLVSNYFILVLFIIRALIDFYIKNKISTEQKKVIKPMKYLFWFIFLSIIGILILNQLHPQNYFSIISILTFGLIPIVYTYGIWKYSLLGIVIKIRRNVQYLSFKIIWKAILFAGVLALVVFYSRLSFDFPNIVITGKSIEFLDKPLRADRFEFYNNLALILISVISLYGVYKLDRLFIRFFDKKFHRTMPDYKKAAMELLSIIKSSLTVNDFSSALVKELNELIKMKTIGIILFDKEYKLCGQAYLGINTAKLSNFCILVGEELVTEIRKYSDEIKVDYLNDPLKEVFKQCHFKYLFPIKSKSNILGTILVGEKLSETPFINDDIQFLSTIADQSSVAIENVLLYEDLRGQERIKHELEIARKIQLASLPENPPEILNLDISGMSVPAYEVGGDFFDYLTNDDKTVNVVVGDVSGKGTSAALHMSKAQGIIRTVFEFAGGPKDILVRTNDLIHKYLDKNSFISVLSASIDTVNNVITLARAGHNPLYYYDSIADKVRRIQPKGIGLGIANSKVFYDNLDEINFEFRSGDAFLFISDGVVEARNNEKEEFEESRLIEAFKNNITYSAKEIKTRIILEVNEFCGEASQYDDFTLVIVKAV